MARISAALLVLLAIAAAACGGETIGPCTETPRLAFDVSGAPLRVGSTGRLSAFRRACGEPLGGVAVDWTLSPDSILRLQVLTDSTAQVTALNEGLVLIRARARADGEEVAQFVAVLAL